MDFKKDFNHLVSKLSTTQIWVWWTLRDPSLKQRMKNMVIVSCVDGFWQHVAKFVFNVSNLLVSQVSTLQTDKQW